MLPWPVGVPRAVSSAACATRPAISGASKGDCPRKSRLSSRSGVSLGDHHDVVEAGRGVRAQPQVVEALQRVLEPERRHLQQAQPRAHGACHRKRRGRRPAQRGLEARAGRQVGDVGDRVGDRERVALRVAQHEQRLVGELAPGRAEQRQVDEAAGLESLARVVGVPGRAQRSGPPARRCGRCREAARGPRARRPRVPTARAAGPPAPAPRAVPRQRRPPRPGAAPVGWGSSSWASLLAANGEADCTRLVADAERTRGPGRTGGSRSTLLLQHPRRGLRPAGLARAEPARGDPRRRRAARRLAPGRPAGTASGTWWCTRPTGSTRCAGG